MRGFGPSWLRIAHFDKAGGDSVMIDWWPLAASLSYPMSHGPRDFPHQANQPPL